MGFYRQEYWSGLPFPSPGDLPNRGIEPKSPALASGFCTADKGDTTWSCTTSIQWLSFERPGAPPLRKKIAQSSPTLWDPMDCSLSGSSVHGIFQARILEWVAISFSRGSSQPRDQTQLSYIAGWVFTIWATREVHHSKSHSIFVKHGLKCS